MNSWYSPWTCSSRAFPISGNYSSLPMAVVKSLVYSLTSPFHSYISASHQQNLVNSTLQIDPKDKSWRFLPSHFQSGQSHHHHSAGLLNSPPNGCPCFCTDLPPGSSQRDPKTQVWYPLSSQNLPMSSHHTQCKSQSCDEDLQGCPRAAQIYIHPCPPPQADTLRHAQSHGHTHVDTRRHPVTSVLISHYPPLHSLWCSHSSLPSVGQVRCARYPEMLGPKLYTRLTPSFLSGLYPKVVFSRRASLAT